MERSQCKDCVCLVENKAGEWFCDECQKPICEVCICPEGIETKTFDITIEETVSQTFSIEASSVEEALKIARDQYLESELVLEPGDLETVKAIHMGTGKEIEIY